MSAEETKAPTPLTEGKWIEPDLFFQGNVLPKGNWVPQDWIEIPHEHYIPISKSRLWAQLSKFELVEKDPLAFQHFIELLEAIYHFHYHKTLNELKEDYEFFSPNSEDDLRQGLSHEELQWRERRFLKNFVKAMMRGNFIPFTEDDLKQANEQNYLFDLAIDINWDRYDSEMLPGFLDEIDGAEGEERREELELDGTMREYLHLPETFNERLLLFYRGIGRDQTTGLFIMQKIDMFTAKLLGFIVVPVQWLVEKFRGGESKTKLSDAVSVLPFNKGKEEEDPLAIGGSDEEGRTTIFERRWVRRVNLQNSKLKLGDVIKPSQLQEPSLDRVIAVFRMNPPQPPQILDRFPAIKRFFPAAKAEEGEKEWRLNIKMFKHIPLADSEIIFPEKTVRMKSFDLAMLILTGIIGLGILIRNLNDPNAKAGTLIIILSGLVAYAIKIFVGYRRARANYMARMTQELYHKSLDNDMGVLQYLVDSLEDQEVKEAVLAYFFLLEAGKPMSEDELDARIEAFIHERFDEMELDFEVDDALDKVLEKEGPQPHKHIPIVSTLEGPDGETLYVAKPLKEALRIMDEKWDNFYEYNV